MDGWTMETTWMAWGGWNGAWERLEIVFPRAGSQLLEQLVFFLLIVFVVSLLALLTRGMLTTLDPHLSLSLS